MADEQEGTEGQAPAGSTPQEGNEAGQEPSGSTLSHEAALAELAKVRQEAAERRTRVQALEAEKAEREKAELSELERAKAEAAEERAKREAAEAAVRERDFRDEVIRLARGANFADPEDAWFLLGGASGVPVVDGKVDGKALEQALRGLIERKPHLVINGNVTTTSAANPSRPASQRGAPTDMDTLMRAALSGKG